MTVITDTDIQSVALASSVTMSANQSCVKTALNASGSAPIYAVRAWATCNSAGTLTDSGNIASCSRTSGSSNNGKYTFTFSTNMTDSNYVIVATAGPDTDNVNMGANVYSRSTSNFVIYTIYSGAYEGQFPDALNVLVLTDA